MQIENNVEMANDEGADPTDDIKKENAGSVVNNDDRHKTEKLAKAGEPEVDPNEENPT